MINLFLSRENLNFKVIKKINNFVYNQKKYHSHQDRVQSMWTNCSVTLDVEGVTDTNSSQTI